MESVFYILSGLALYAYWGSVLYRVHDWELKLKQEGKYYRKSTFWLGAYLLIIMVISFMLGMCMFSYGLGLAKGEF